jgi:hypothetical protein
MCGFVYVRVDETVLESCPVYLACCRQLQDATYGQVGEAVLVRMLDGQAFRNTPFTANPYIQEAQCWSALPDTHRSCTAVIISGRQQLPQLGGFVHMLPLDQLGSIDKCDSHTASTADKQSAAQDTCMRVDTLFELVHYFRSLDQSWNHLYNEVCAPVNATNVVGLVYCTDSSGRNFDESVGHQMRDFLRCMKSTHTEFSKLPLFEFNAVDGNLTLVDACN